LDSRNDTIDVEDQNHGRIVALPVANTGKWTLGVFSVTVTVQHGEAFGVGVNVSWHVSKRIRTERIDTPCDFQ